MTETLREQLREVEAERDVLIAQFDVVVQSYQTLLDEARGQLGGLEARIEAYNATAAAADLSTDLQEAREALGKAKRAIQQLDHDESDDCNEDGCACSIGRAREVLRALSLDTTEEGE